jgi:hypothetical protein
MVIGACKRWLSENKITADGLKDSGSRLRKMGMELNMNVEHSTYHIHSSIPIKVPIHYPYNISRVGWVI